MSLPARSTCKLPVDDAVAKNDHDLMTVFAAGFGLFLLVNVGAGLLRSLALVHLQTGLAYEMSSVSFTTFSACRWITSRSDAPVTCCPASPRRNRSATC